MHAVWWRRSGSANHPSISSCSVRITSAIMPGTAALTSWRLEMPELPTGTVTFLFTDIEGSTARWEQQTQAMHVALARHDAILRDAILGHSGAIVKTTGDGVHAVFWTAPDAVAAALA